jgi:hypothetical protein
MLQEHQGLRQLQLAPCTPAFLPHWQLVRQWQAELVQQLKL